MTGGLTAHRGLAPEQLSAVLALVAAAGRADGVPPLGEQPLLDLRRGRDATGWTLLVAGPAGAPVGVAHLSGAGPDGGPGSAELAVHPDARRRGVGRALVAGLEHEAPGDLDIWSHGRLPAAAALAERLGYRAGRVLLQLRMDLTGDLPEPVLPDGVEIRPFVPGADDAAWLRANARAFADHPEQGGWTAVELAERQVADWFDPAGFLLAVEAGAPAGALLGFHWTKVHPDGGRDGAPIGEIYVLGVDPAAQGRRLGPALSLAGLRWLRAQGLEQVMLYVDESNGGAVAMYERLGFTPWAVDVMYHRSG